MTRARRRHEWQNRIVGSDLVSPDQLLANPRNWRIHPKHQQDALSGLLRQVGWVQEVIVNRRTGYVVDGHLRVALAISESQPAIPVKYVDLDEAEEALVLATLDPIGALADADSEQLNALIRDVRTQDAALRTLLADLERNAPVEAPTLAEVDEVSPAEELQERWRVEPGQLWRIPSATVRGDCHRVLCGDTTNATDMAKVMGGRAAEMVWTDPPYGMDIGAKNRELNEAGWARRVTESFVNDDLDEKQRREMWDAAVRAAIACCVPAAAWYVTAPSGPMLSVFMGVLRDHGILRQLLVWVKNNATLALPGMDYRNAHEFMLYGWVPNGGHRFYGGPSQTTVWEVDRPRASPLHPTQKPLELVARAIENSSRPGDVVLDMFAGSGSTLVAAEQIGRIGFGVEIEPKYVAVTLERLAGLGLTPELESVDATTHDR